MAAGIQVISEEDFRVLVMEAATFVDHTGTFSTNRSSAVHLRRLSSFAQRQPSSWPTPRTGPTRPTGSPTHARRMQPSATGGGTTSVGDSLHCTDRVAEREEEFRWRPKSLELLIARLITDHACVAQLRP